MSRLPPVNSRRIKRVGRRELERAAKRDARRGALPILDDYDRPRTRGECPVLRPCPFVACRYHLYLDVADDGAIIFNFPELEVDEMLVSCALDFADRDEDIVSLDEVAIVLNLTPERVRQISEEALKRLRTAAKLAKL